MAKGTRAKKRVSPADKFKPGKPPKKPRGDAAIVAAIARLEDAIEHLYGLVDSTNLKLTNLHEMLEKKLTDVVYAVETSAPQ